MKKTPEKYREPLFKLQKALMEFEAETKRKIKRIDFLKDLMGLQYNFDVTIEPEVISTLTTDLNEQPKPNA